MQQKPETNEEIEKEAQQCQEAADMVVDALIDGGLITLEMSDKATEIVMEELIVRKALRRL